MRKSKRRFRTKSLPKFFALFWPLIPHIALLGQNFVNLRSLLMCMSIFILLPSDVI